jgi:hypothetical protein
MDSSPDTTDAANPLMNPYAPPAAAEAEDERPAKKRRRVLSGWVYAYGAMLLLSFGLEAIAIFMQTAIYMGTVIRLAAMAVGLGWLHATWNRLPHRLQQVNSVQTSAGAVVFRHFIPLFGLFWLFQVPTALCGSLDMKLHEKGYPASAPLVLGRSAGAAWLLASFVSHLSPLAGFAVATVGVFSWLAYMIRVEQTFALAFRRKRA